MRLKELDQLKNSMTSSGIEPAIILERNKREIRFFHTGFLLGLFFNPEDGGDIFLRNVG
jgi:hypothetical protein